MSQQWVMEQTSMTIYGSCMLNPYTYPTMLEGFSDIFQLVLGEDRSPSITIGMMWGFYMIMIRAVLVLLPAGKRF